MRVILPKFQLKKKGKMPTTKKCLASNWLTFATFGGVVGGVVMGVIMRVAREEPWTDREAMYVEYIGKLFLSALKSIIIPLIVPSLIVAIGTLDLSLSGKVGLRAVCYYMVTTLIAIIIGIILVLAIHPGQKISADDEPDDAKPRNVTTPDTLMDLLRNLVPSNVIQATMQQTRTVLTYPDDDDTKRNQSDKYTWAFKQEYSNNSNILGLVLWSIILGVAIAAAGEPAKTVLDFFNGISTIMMLITQWIINLAPVGVLFLVAGQVLRMSDPQKVFMSLGAYFGTVLAGLAIHGLIVLPLIFGLLTRRWPFRYVANMGNALFTAFGTASSSATLPVTIEAIEKKNNVDERITRFVLPIGATINMDGTALYEAVAAIFIAQVRGITLSIDKVIAISITATAASIGAAGIPQAGLVTMVMVLNTVGLPSTDIALILSIDWLLDRFRTAINVLGDAIGAGIVYHLSKSELEEMDKRDEMELEEANGNGRVNPGFDQKP